MRRVGESSSSTGSGQYVQVLNNRRRQCRLRGIPLIMALGAVLSLGVETLQCWLPNREPSWLDVAANCASSGLGAGLHFIANSAVFGRMKRLLFDRLR